MQRDLVLRWLEQIRALLARLILKDPDASAELLEQQIDAALGQVIGTSSDLIDRLDPPAAAALLADPFRIYGYAELLTFKAGVLEARGGDPDRCQAMTGRGLALMKLALQRADPVPADWPERIQSIERDLGGNPG